MDQHYLSSPIQPIYNNMIDSQFDQYFTHQAEQGADTDTASASTARGGKSVSLLSSSSSRSPTTIFAVDELSGVFRVPDDAIERGCPDFNTDSHQEKESVGIGIASSTSNITRRRCLTPSFTTDGEMSTFSEDTEEDDEGEGSSDSNGVANHFRFPIRRSRRSSSSIFRPVVSGTKRRCEFEDDDDDEDSRPSTPTKRCRSAPTLCHANPIGSSDGDDGCDDELALPTLSPGQFGSPFKRICRTSNNAASSSFTSLFAEARGATITDARPGDMLSVMPNQLQHPLSFKPWPVILKAKSIVDDDC